MVKIRLEGERGELADAMAELAGCAGLRVLQVSEPYANRGSSLYYRVYVDAEVVAANDGGRRLGGGSARG